MSSQTVTVANVHSIFFYDMSQIYFNKYLEKYQQGLRQLERRKVKHEDWNLFQMCLTLMQTIGNYCIA